jgi:hypothetical protein
VGEVDARLLGGLDVGGARRVAGSDLDDGVVSVRSRDLDRACHYLDNGGDWFGCVKRGHCASFRLSVACRVFSGPSR